MAKSQKYKFEKREQSKGGRTASFLALASAALFAAAVIVSFAQGGKAGTEVGGLALIAILFSVYGFIVGMKSFREKDVSPVLSIIGSIACGVIMVCWLTLFLAGIR
ncbi:MAG: DUF6142 family protein [Lachnospiraceae bacterium]|jgi:uncharacterized membrane protein YsdA (DUF1294 family)|nr:DUF6142 family protein [Lachnospiraceae bacterium]MCI1727706.1 DUF6142 family protein [Lachnospiraceae bacterium]